MLFFDKKVQKYLLNSKNCCTFAPAFGREARHPASHSVIESVAQQVEHIPFKDGVLGSSPSWFTEQQQCCFFLYLLVKYRNDDRFLISVRINACSPFIAYE